MKQNDGTGAESRQSYDQPFIQYLVYFHADRDYFECHEVMEEHWKACPDSPYRQAWLGLIQVAVSQYHERRNNFKGALMMITSAISHLRAIELEQLGLSGKSLILLLTERKQLLEKRLADAAEERTERTERTEQTKQRAFFTDLNLPISDLQLEQACKDLCQQRGVVWHSASDLTDNYIIHKHRLRDRSEVVSERSRRLKEKQLARQRQS